VSKVHTVIVVDDHAIMRDGLKALISAEDDLEVVGTAGDGREAIPLAAELRPDLVLLDLSMPRSGGVEAIPSLKRRVPGIKVMVLTLHKDDAHIHAALGAGADGYVLKEDSRNELLMGIRSVANGKSYLSPSICDRVVFGFLRGGNSETPQPSSWEPLTRREREVMKLVAEGMKTREIAEYLSLSPKTVEKHRANMMRKLDLHNASAVTAYAIANGFVPQ